MQRELRYLQSFLMVLMVGFLVAGCGGGGGGGSTTTELTEAEARRLTAGTLGGVQAISSVNPSSSVSVSSESEGLVVRVFERTFACSNGGEIVLEEAEEGAFTFNTGDEASFTYQECREGSNLINGLVRLLVREFDVGSSLEPQFTVDLGLVFENLRTDNGTTTAQLQGDAIVTTTTEADSARVITTNSIQVLRATVNGRTMEFRDYGLSSIGTRLARERRVSFAGEVIDEEFGTYSTRSIEGLLWSNDSPNPRSGSAELESDSWLITVTVLSDLRVRLELDNGKDGSIDSSRDYSWVELTDPDFSL